MTTRFLRLLLATLLVAGATAAGCGDDTSGGGDASADAGGGGDAVAGDTAPATTDAALPAGVRPTIWTALADASKKQVCDWIAGQFGGYGRERTCPDGRTIPSIYQSQDECLM